MAPGALALFEALKAGGAGAGADLQEARASRAGGNKLSGFSPEDKIFVVVGGRGKEGTVAPTAKAARPPLPLDSAAHGPTASARGT